MLNELKGLLGVKKTDTARQWCIHNNVHIFGKHSKRWVRAMDVQVAMDSDVIAQLITEFGNEHWFAVYKMYMEGDVEGLVKVKFSGILSKNRTSGGYAPRSEEASRFLNDLP